MQAERQDSDCLQKGEKNPWKLINKEIIWIIRRRL
jgi:hypothetical protein